MSEHSHWKKILLGLVLTMLCWSPSRAQQEPPSTPDDSTSSKQVDSSPTVPLQLEVRPAGRTSPLLSYDSFLRWGPIFVRTVQFLQNYDQIHPVSGTGQGIFNQNGYMSSVFYSDIVFDKQFRQSRLEIQYSPRLAIVNGNVSSNFLNQNANLNWIQQLSPRWTLGVNPSVIYMQVRQLYGEFFLGANSITATTLPNSFLDGPGSWLTSNLETTLAYALSPTSSVSVAPFFGYSHLGGVVNGLQSSSIYQYGGKVGLDKRLSPTRGIYGNYYARFVGDIGSGILYQSGEIGYGQKFGPSTDVAVSGGLLTVGFARRQWDVSGSVQLSRKLGRSNAAVGYYRGFPLFSETATQGVAQRVDASYRLDLSQRWYSQVHGGYEDTLGSNATNFSGKYIAAEFGYNLNPRWSCFVTYAYKTQSGTDPGLFGGSRDFYSGGIRWSALPIQ